MKRKLLAAAVAVLMAGAASAADLGRGPAPYYSAPAVSGYNWAGFYAGLNAGYEWGKVSGTAGNPSGLAGGVQAGYNWQNGQFVFGGETDLQLSGADDTFAPWKFSNPWFGTLRGRVGYAMNNILFYGTGGLAYGDLKGELNSLTETKTEFGWTLGAGMEVGLAPNWSAKVEYLYMDLGSRSFSITGNENGFSASVLRLGVNYHF
ncbi:MAG TPA: outer membrane protein [Pseudolabrys sp.]|jgi:outer membrane immunogenic protein|nr:outer membrane protein [Pseudolabrys sp.]